MRQLAFALLPLAMIACHASSVPMPSPATSILPSPVTRAATSQPIFATPAGASAASSGLVPIPGGCGTVQVQNVVVSNGAAAGIAEGCFWQAYQRCASGPTTQLVVVADAGPGRTSRSIYTLNNSAGKCMIQEAFIVGPSDPQSTAGGATTAGICASMSRDTNGALHLMGCTSGGNLDIPRP